jgi:hypothetical protein
MAAVRTFSAARPIGLNLAVAFLMILMWAVISLDGNAQQEAFNRGGIYVVLATAIVYVVVALALMRRPLTNSPIWFIRRGGMCLMLAGMLIYIVLMSIRTGRVL